MTPSEVYRLECLQRARERRIAKVLRFLAALSLGGVFSAALYAIVRGGMR